MKLLLDLTSSTLTQPESRERVWSWFSAWLEQHPVDAIDVLAPRGTQGWWRRMMTLSGTPAPFTVSTRWLPEDLSGDDDRRPDMSSLNRVVHAGALSHRRPDLVLTFLDHGIRPQDAGAPDVGPPWHEPWVVVCVGAANEPLRTRDFSPWSAVLERASLVITSSEALTRALGEACPSHRDRVLTEFPASLPAESSGSAKVEHPSRPRLALVSPLPPVKSGVADYSAYLLGALTRHFALDVILVQDRFDPAFVPSGVLVRTASAFEAEAAEYDHVLYHLGNSPAHAEIRRLALTIPGIVVLHDFFLPDLVAYCESVAGQEGELVRALAYSHGYPALLELAESSREEIIRRYPCSLDVIASAKQVLVHSAQACALAREWYGDAVADRLDLVPHARPRPPRLDRAGARRTLGIPDDALLICSFGQLGDRKMSVEIAAAWATACAASVGQASHLVFVGDVMSETYLADIRAAAAISGQCAVSITGFVSEEAYRCYLSAADLAIQLRTRSRGETSGAVLDCLAYGVPTIVNAHGSLAELPQDVVHRLPDEFTAEQLVAAIDHLSSDAIAREALSNKAIAYVAERHDVDRVVDKIAAVLSRERDTRHACEAEHAARLLADMPVVQSLGPQALQDVATALFLNQPPLLPRQLLVDVSAIVQTDLRTGIQRVVRGTLSALIRNPPSGYRVEPVYSLGMGQSYRYARSFTQALLQIGDPGLPDDPIHVLPGDVFLGLDLNIAGVSQNQGVLASYRAMGLAIFFVVYDVLPLQMPDAFPSNTEGDFRRWLSAITNVSDGLVAISRSVANDLRPYLAELLLPGQTGALRVGAFHLGADLSTSVPSSGISRDAERLLKRARKVSLFLMVGTVEPRKGHAQVLDAFERLWLEGMEVDLLIVGRAGWKVDQLTKRMRSHSEAGARFTWIEDASDELLERCYSCAHALIAASSGEGFGLPLIEAAKHGLPLIARDIPVFREVAGPHAYFFSAPTADELAAALKDWIALAEQGRVPESSGLPWLDWQRSSAQLKQVIFNDQWLYQVDFQNADRPTRASL